MSKTCQYKYRRTTFSTVQYWNINYTEVDPTGKETDYKVFIKAKSYPEAKRFLKKRLESQDPPATAKSIQGFMFHEKYKNASNRKLGVKEWEQIRSAAFPNFNNVLYKLEVPRDPEKTNRFNTTDYERMREIGFKKGKENWSVKNTKGKSLPPAERHGMIYRGKWIKWDKEEMKATRQEIINALILNDGNRMKAAKYMKVSRHKFYDLMAKFPEVDWNKEYPPPRPFVNSTAPSFEVRSKAQKKSMKKRMAEGFKPFDLSPEQEATRVENIKACSKTKKEAYIEEMLPKVKDALSRHSNHRRKAAEDVGMTCDQFSKFLSKTKHLVNWAQDYPSPFGLKPSPSNG